jgi:multicomponent Na+:H+ antiporter subunit F
MTVDVLAVANVVFALLTLAMALTFVRLVRGPSLADRVVALDVLAAIAVGIAATATIVEQQLVLLDAAIVLALIAFLATVAFATYLERRARDE